MSSPARIGGILLAAVLLLPGQSPPLVRVPVRLVVAPTLVLSPAGQAVTGLDANRFELFDNGRRQKIQLDVESEPSSILVAVQANDAISDYLPLIIKTGSVFDSLLLGANGKGAVLAYGDDVKLIEGVDFGDVSHALAKVTASGREAHMLDAAERALQLLKVEPAGRARVLLLIGQPYDNGSAATVAKVMTEAAADNVQIYALVLPLAGKKFVADTFRFPSMTAQRGGVGVGVELTSLIPALRYGAKSTRGADAFSQLTTITGGTQIHFRKQAQLENGLIAMGVELRSTYSLSYTPDSTQPGYHSIRVIVSVPGAITYSRAGYEY